MLTIFLKKFVASNSISEETRRSLKPVGTRPGIMYGFRKVHKDIIDNCPPFLPLSAINTSTYKLVPILKSLTSNGYMVKDTVNLLLLKKLLNKIWNFLWEA